MLPRVTEAVDALVPEVPEGNTVAGFEGANALRAQALWTQIAQLPLLTKARFAPGNAAYATVTLETNDVVRNTKVAAERLFDLKAKAALPTVAGSGLAEKPPATFHSPSRTRALRFVAKDDEWRVEVWREAALEAVLPAKGVHGKPLTDAMFQQVMWSADEESVIFVAERHAPKAPALWEAAADTDSTRGAYEFRDNWGEVYQDYSHLTIIHADLRARKLRDVLPTAFTDKCSATCPVLLRDGATLIFIGFECTPRRLGIVHCSSRKSRLYTVSLALGDDAVPAQPKDVTVFRSMRQLTRDPASDRVVAFAAHDTSPAHLTCLRLVAFDGAAVAAAADGAAAKPLMRIVVDNVDTPASPEDFPGLYSSGGWTDLTWLAGTTVLLNSIWRSANTLLRVDVTCAKAVVQRVTHDTVGTWKVLDVRGKAVLASFSTACSPPSLRYCSDALVEAPDFVTVYDGADAMPDWMYSAAADIRTSVYRPPSESCHDSEALHTSSGGQATSTLVVVHGGPHGADTSMFSRGQLYYALSGFDMFSVNYGGSIGFGQRRVDELHGCVGTSDVQDVIACVDWAVAQQIIDPSRLTLTGGSHGGFLTCHLTAQYPGKFVAASVRNPVTVISSMHFVTDIPDWCMCEAGHVPHSGAQAMFDCSPMAHVSKCRTPTLIGIGMADLRVPPSQGIAWFHALREAAPDVDVRMLRYTDANHGLDTLAAEADFAVMNVLFFMKHL